MKETTLPTKTAKAAKPSKDEILAQMEAEADEANAPISRARHTSTPAPSSDYDGCTTDTAIDHAYRTLVLKAMKEAGGQFLTPAVRDALQEDHRRAHVRLVNGSGGGEPRAKRVAQDRPTSGRCEHCGEPTKGGRFVAGHDAKLKGELLRLALDGDHEALAEMMLRPAGWFKKPERFDPGVVRQAEEIVQAVKTDEWLANRVAARLEGK